MSKENIIGSTIAALIIAISLLVIVIFISLFTIPIHALLLMLSWNYALKPLFALPQIGFLQSVALVIIARILIKSSHTTTNSTTKS